MTEGMVAGFSTVFIIIFVIIEIIMSFVPIFIIVFIISTIAKRTKNTKFFKQSILYTNNVVGTKAFENEYKEVSKSQLNQFGIDDIEDIKNYLYHIFYLFESAYNNLDLEGMKKYSYKQLYENYITGIKLDKNMGKKKIITDLSYKELLLTGLDSTKVKQVATMVITINYLNYIVDNKGELISGDREGHITETFEVEFRKDLNDAPTNCPNCGGKIDADDVVCDYCESVVNSEEDFKIYSIKKIVTK